MSDRLVKWEDRRRDQMSATNNLMLTFGIAICGYLADKVITDKDFLLIGELKCGFTFAFLSVIFGALLTISRLYDFKYTVKKIREEEDNGKTTKMETYKSCADNFGKISWVLFWGQILTLMSSIVFLYLYISNLIKH